jgi:hypothetical protein
MDTYGIVIQPEASELEVLHCCTKRLMFIKMYILSLCSAINSVILYDLHKTGNHVQIIFLLILICITNSFDQKLCFSNLRAQICCSSLIKPTF